MDAMKLAVKFFDIEANKPIIEEMALKMIKEDRFYFKHSDVDISFIDKSLKKQIGKGKVAAEDFSVIDEIVALSEDEQPVFFREAFEYLGELCKRKAVELMAEKD